jgi:hypothetical protein
MGWPRSRPKVSLGLIQVPCELGLNLVKVTKMRHGLGAMGHILFKHKCHLT